VPITEDDADLVTAMPATVPATMPAHA